MITRTQAARLAEMPQDSREAANLPVVGGLDQPLGNSGSSVIAAPLSPTALGTLPVRADLAVPTSFINESPSYRSRSQLSASSQSTSSTVRARKLAAEALLARQQLEREMELERKRKLVEDLELRATLAADDVSHTSSRSADSRTRSWVKNASIDLNLRRPHSQLANEEIIPPCVNEPVPSHLHASKNTRNVSFSIGLSNNVMSPMPSRNSNKFYHDSSKEFKSCYNRPISHKCATKYVDLMLFSGKPVEWLMFKRTYEDTKHLFSPTENLTRLRCALRGPALECVSSLLYTTESPDYVMEMLRQTFAQPETIVLHEMATVRALPKISHDQKELFSFASRIRNCIAVINNLDQREYLYSVEIFHTVLSKLTPILYSQWKEFAYRNVDRSLCKLELLSKFLDIEADKHNRFGLMIDFTRQYRAVPLLPNNFVHRRDNVHSATIVRSNVDKCKYCNGKHSVSDCKDFKALTLEEKWIWLRQVKICFKCLKAQSHRWKTCKIRRCGVDGCVRFHHPLLHSSTSSQSSQVVHMSGEAPLVSHTLDEVPTNQDCAKSVLVTNVMEQFSHTKVFLKMLPVEVTGPKGTHHTYALLDDGSTATLIDSEVARRIGASGRSDSIKVDGVAGMSTYKPVEYVSFTIRGRNSTEVFKVNNAKAIDTLSLYRQTISPGCLSQYSYLNDISEFLLHENAVPEVLIGADHWFLTVSREFKEGAWNQPLAARTALGWVLHGKATSKWAKRIFVNHVSLIDDTNNNSMDEIIRDYFRLDSIGISKQSFNNKDDKHALYILESTTKRLQSGRFEVGLLWQKEKLNVPDSYPHALSRFLGVERRMARDTNFKNAYFTFMHNMFEKGYAEECPTDTYHDLLNESHINSPNVRWYLPHFAVVHPQKHKLRIVHDAAAKTDGVSLNSLLLSGPDLLQSLLHILFRFREGRIALIADVKEMFPQIRIQQRDRDALRFLWRDDTDQKIKEYRMTSVVFGVICSPCTALYIKNRNAQELQTSYPAACEAIIYDHYMDDYLGSLDSLNEASQLAADIITVHKAAGMEMRSWVSNEPAALLQIPEDLRASLPISNIRVGPEAFVRTLGLIWYPGSDNFGFRQNLHKVEALTKRKLLSHLMSVYDPLGLLAPLVIQGRILFQQVWRTGCDWDCNLDQILVDKWWSWSRQLDQIADVRIPRWYRCGFIDAQVTERQLHVFADASEEAYACVAYWRFTFADDSVKLSLIGGKARLAPLKPSSVPRLELQAALIAARFAESIAAGHKVQIHSIFLWSDSTIVLNWIRSDARTYKPFVANRIGEITEISNPGDWKYVPSILNVADDATRLKQQDVELKRWLSGPDFLLLPSSDWPKEPPATSTFTALEEQKSAKVVIGLTNLHELPSPVTAEPKRFSVWLRFVRATARTHRCVQIFRHFLETLRLNSNSQTNRSFSEKSSALTALEIENAERAIFKKSQIDSFSTELGLLYNSKTLPVTSKLHMVSPVLDEHGLLRLDSRIHHMKGLPRDTASPIILDGRHLSVRLLIHHHHVRAGHGHNEMIYNELKQRFWIPNCRNAVKAVARNCQSCKIRKAKPSCPPMGDIPALRLEHHERPFTNVGLDYFGPLEVSVGRRREKRYVALFTCMTTRAVHLEVVSSLSADSAISCLRRFIARRGTPLKILSDNGTGFVGASRQLAEFYGQAVEDFAANNKIQWSFIPPASPFMGGCWERLVRTIKTALKTTLKDRAPKEETLSTLLLEAEALANSRPLTYVTRNDTVESLTPFHFLIGSSSNHQLPYPLDDGVFSLRKEWQKALRLSEHFWRRWLREYLPCLRVRRPQQRGHQNLEIGDVVLVVDYQAPRGTWIFGKVIGLHPGADGVVRVADVTTKGGILRRPTKKLALIAPAAESMV